MRRMWRETQCDWMVVLGVKTRTLVHFSWSLLNFLCSNTFQCQSVLYLNHTVLHLVHDDGGDNMTSNHSLLSVPP